MEDDGEAVEGGLEVDDDALEMAAGGIGGNVLANSEFIGYWHGPENSYN